MVGSWKVEISFGSEKIEATIDDQLRMIISRFEPQIGMEEAARMVNAINAVVYFLRNNSGTRFEVTEQP